MGEQIVLQDSLDDDSTTGKGAVEPPEHDLPREDFRGEDHGQEGTECIDDFPRTNKGQKRDQVDRKRMPFTSSGDQNVPDGDGITSFPPEAPVQYLGLRGQSSVYANKNVGRPHDDRYNSLLNLIFLCSNTLFHVRETNSASFNKALIPTTRNWISNLYSSLCHGKVLWPEHVNGCRRKINLLFICIREE